MKIACFLLLAVSINAADFGGWTTASPRAEIRPSFSTDTEGSLAIVHDQREGLDGWFQRTYSINGGEWYRFQVRRKVNGVSNPRQSCLVRIVWQDRNGKLVNIDERPVNSDPRLPMPSAEPEYPTDDSTDELGWTTVNGVYKSPSQATQAVIELHLQWAPNGRVEWREALFEPTTAPAARLVRLATVHYKPHGKTPRENCEEFGPLIAKAAQERADLVVLGETVPSAGLSARPEHVAEPVPGPSTKYFADLARKHHLYLVLSLLERDEHLIYNTAVLLGPDGSLIGKYRKTTLPPSEAAKGIAPGRDYPVFDTALGRIGLMICYDGFFPEVARELTKNGAEIIAWPVWGCNPKLAAARACENHVYLVSSTFMGYNSGWGFSAIYDHNGDPLSTAKEWGTVAIAEVALNHPYLGPYNLGDFRSMLDRHRPTVPTKD